MLSGIIVALVVAFLCWIAAALNKSVRNRLDRRKARRFLQSLPDELGESHADLPAVCQGTGLSEERARAACMSDGIYCFGKEPELWSVWRKAPQSVYEKRGLLLL